MPAQLSKLAPFLGMGTASVGTDALLYGSNKAGDLLRNMGILPDIAKISKEAAIKKQRGDITGRYIPGSAQTFFSTPEQTQAPPAVIEGSPQARAEAQERSRVAQLTEQDPLFKKYKVAELTKAYNTATPEEKERIGLEIWATTNPQLASKVRPGQVGYQTSAAMSGTQVFGSEIPGITQASYQQAVEGANKIPFSGMAAPDMSAYGMGANAIQFGTTAPGTPPLSMIGENVFNKGFDVPSSKDLSQTQLALLKRAFEGRLK